MGSNQDWIRWGMHDPLFGVAAWPGHERGGPQAWTDEDFYELGRSDWADFVARWLAYGVDTSACVEIGSGAGRLTKHMAGSFDRVYATDVSVDMLAYARKNIETENVAFVLTNGRDLPIEAESVTAAFSTHVFQHFDSWNSGNKYFLEIARVLTDGGSLMIHLPLHSFPFGPGVLSAGVRLLYSTRKKMGGLYAASKRLVSNLIGTKPSMRGLSYEMAWVQDSLSRLGFAEIEFALFSVKSNGGMHSFVFARKRPACIT
jgi:ubiquinone/menaquinone biosynthesis C-methylase UbiE